MAGEPRTKAFTATLNRIARKFGVTAGPTGEFHVVDPPMTLFIETTATLTETLPRLLKIPGDVFVVMTNREGLREALRIVAGTRIGVMDPHGRVEKPAGDAPASPKSGGD